MAMFDEKINAKFVMFSMAIFHFTALPLPNKIKMKTARKLRVFSLIIAKLAAYDLGDGALQVIYW